MSGLAGLYDLKDEKQAKEYLEKIGGKEYLEKIGIEYRFQCYHEKLPDGCHRLADFLAAFHNDWEKARIVFEKNCYEHKYGQSCLKFGHYNLVGRAGECNNGQAYKAYILGCDNGHAPCCYHAALMQQTGAANEGGVSSFSQAAKLLKRGCQGGNTPSCALLSSHYITGKEGLPKDMVKAFEFAKKACDEGTSDMPSCANVSRMYRLGEGTKQNLELAEKYMSKAKDLHQAATQHERPIAFGE